MKNCREEFSWEKIYVYIVLASNYFKNKNIVYLCLKLLYYIDIDMISEKSLNS